MQILLDLRNEFRESGEFDKADIIRDRLTLLGIQLEDHPTGTTWRLSPEAAEQA